VARLEYIRLPAQRIEVENDQVRWVATQGRVVERLPQIIWSNHSAWGEANLWALEQASFKHIKTVHSSMTHLLGYAKWLEAESIDWWHFPARISERCLPRFRGALIRARNDGEMAQSTVSVRMTAIIRFYRWLQATGIISTSWPMWTERQIGIRIANSFGFEHTLRVTTTNLAIPNTKVAGAIGLEDGVMPLTAEGMSQVIKVANAKASAELALMLRAGFGTGLRLGSILDLKLATIEQAAIDPVSGSYRIAVGPGARPPVATKFGMSGMVPVPTSLLEQLRDYACSTRRLKREALAKPENRNLLFLTRFGNPYSDIQSRAINVEMLRLRRAGETAGVEAFREFHFHRTRATFATMLMRAALRCLPVVDAVEFVREACLHKNVETTLKYVKFIESSKAMSESADAFTQAFMGLTGWSRDI